MGKQRIMKFCRFPRITVVICALIVTYFILTLFPRKLNSEISIDEGDSPNSKLALCGGKHTGPSVQSPYFEERKRVYDEMSTDYLIKGPAFISGGETSQSLKLSDLFTFHGNVVKPILKKADPAVRANVLHLDNTTGHHLMQEVTSTITKYFDGGNIWLQDADVIHASLFHASHHLTPVPVSEEEVEKEAQSVGQLASHTCPLLLSLDRIVLTSTGVVLGCWQLLEGTEPSELRRHLRKIFPNAPEKQLYNEFMLHTSFARLLGPPKVDGTEEGQGSEAIRKSLDKMVSELNSKLCLFQTMVEELWFVEEFHLLALALQGEMKQRKYILKCQK